MRCIGYYITEIVEKPEYVSVPSELIVSASSCICNMHPDLNGCFWLGHEKEKKKYQNRLALSDEEFKGMSDMVAKLFEDNKIDTDSRILALGDAEILFKRYLRIKHLKIIGMFTLEKYAEQLIGEDNLGRNAKLSNENMQGMWIGNEIVGYDYACAGFHSYLCNHLDKDIMSNFDVHYNSYGLIENDYEQVEAFAQRIQGMGEPVNWIPVALYDFTS